MINFKKEAKLLLQHLDDVVEKHGRSQKQSDALIIQTLAESLLAAEVRGMKRAAVIVENTPTEKPHYRYSHFETKCPDEALRDASKAIRDARKKIKI